MKCGLNSEYFYLSISENITRKDIDELIASVKDEIKKVTSK